MVGRRADVLGPAKDARAAEAPLSRPGRSFRRPVSAAAGPVVV